MVASARFFHVMGVGVNVIAHEEEELRLRRGNDWPDIGVFRMRFVAGTAGEASDGLFKRVGGHRRTAHEGDERSCAEIAK